MAAMSKGQDPVTILAPRELRDLVYRCCRVEGVDPANADRFADNLLHAQIHRGAGVEVFLSVLGSSGSSKDDLAPLTTAADSIEVAEATARSEGVATATYDSAVPLMALSHSLWHAAERGTAGIGISATAPGDQEVDNIDFVTEKLDQAARTSAHQRHLTAHRKGLAVATSSFAQLESRAARFLVSEATLDAITS